MLITGSKILARDLPVPYRCSGAERLSESSARLVSSGNVPASKRYLAIQPTGGMTMVESIDPQLWGNVVLRRALAHHDISAVYRLLTESGVPQGSIAQATGQSQSEVSEIIAGRRVQSYDVLLRIADGFGLPRGWLGLAFDEPVASETGEVEEVSEDVKRRAFLAVASTALFGRPVLGEVLEIPHRPDTPTPLPSQLGSADVDALSDLTRHMRNLARQWGGQADSTSAIAQRATRLLQVPASGSIRARLGSTLAELHTEAGWCCFDSGLHDQAQRHWQSALEIGDEAGDSYQVAYTLRHAGIALAERGHDNDGLKFFHLGQYRLQAAAEDPRSVSLGAWLHAESAIALARMDRADLARAELDMAQDGWRAPDLFERADMEYLAASVMKRLGVEDEAERLTAASLSRYGDNRRDAAKAVITLATLHAQAGELGTAARAIRAVAELRSVRARDRLAPLADALAARPGAEARELAGHARRVATA